MLSKIQWLTRRKVINKIVSDPWPHIVIDNFFNENLYQDIVRQTLQSELYAKVAKHDKIATYLNYDEFGNIVQNNNLDKCLSSDVIDDIYEYYFDECVDLLSQLDSSKVPDLKYMQIGVTYCGSNYTGEKVHVDRPEKLLSIVVYIAPEENIGTVLYKNETEISKQIDWKPNRSLIFSRDDDQTPTWHHYYSNKNKRVAVIINLLRHFMT